MCIWEVSIVQIWKKKNYPKSVILLQNQVTAAATAVTFAAFISQIQKLIFNFLFKKSPNALNADPFTTCQLPIDTFKKALPFSELTFYVDPPPAKPVHMLRSRAKFRGCADLHSVRCWCWAMRCCLVFSSRLHPILHGVEALCAHAQTPLLLQEPNAWGALTWRNKNTSHTKLSRFKWIVT